MQATALILVALAVAIPLAQLPLDLLCGYAVEAVLGREDRTLREWLAEWLRGKIPCMVALAVGFGFFWAAFVVGPWPLLAAACVLILLILAGTGRGARDASLSEPILRAASDLGESRLRLRWFDGDVLVPVNGYSLPWVRETVFVSRSTAVHLAPEAVAALALRELWLQRSGRHAAGCGLAVAWCLLVVSAGLAIPADSPLTAALGGAAVVSVLSFAALFVLPVWNRRWNAEADAQLAKRIGAEKAKAILAQVQRLNATDTHLPAAKAAVFHPIPPLEQRTLSLQ